MPGGSANRRHPTGTTVEQSQPPPVTFIGSFGGSCDSPDPLVEPFSISSSSIRLVAGTSTRIYEYLLAFGADAPFLCHIQNCLTSVVASIHVCSSLYQQLNERFGATGRQRLHQKRVAISVRL